MKGQYRIVFETMLILIGIFITSYVAVNFENVRVTVTGMAAEDGFTSVANNIILGLEKASENPGSSIAVDIPEKVSGYVYKIDLNLGDNNVTIMALENPGINVTRQIFNIGKGRNYIRTDYQVVSSAGVVNIIYDANTNELEMKRLVCPADLPDAACSAKR